MKYFTTAFLFLLVTTVALAQNADSVQFVNAAWKVDQLARKIQLKRFHFTKNSLFGANQYLSFVIVKPNRKRRFKIAAERSILKRTSNFGEESNALVAVNGNFFDTKNGGAVDYTRVNGTVINENKLSKDGKRSFHQQAAIVMHKNSLLIKKWDDTDSWEQHSFAEADMMLNGPLLFLKRQLEPLDSSAFNANRHPRTCVGVTQKGDIIILVADGRNSNAAGLSLFELTKIMQWLGCVSAINFDGGGSSTLWTKKLGVVNHPSDNQQWDHEGERKVANVLLIK